MKAAIGLPTSQAGRARARSLAPRRINSSQPAHSDAERRPEFPQIVTARGLGGFAAFWMMWRFAHDWEVFLVRCACALYPCEHAPSLARVRPRPLSISRITHTLFFFPRVQQGFKKPWEVEH